MTGVGTEGGVKTPGTSWTWSRLTDELVMRDAELRTMSAFLDGDAVF